MPNSVTYFPIKKKSLDHPETSLSSSSLYCAAPPPPHTPYVGHPAKPAQAPVFTRSPECGIINRQLPCAQREKRMSDREKNSRYASLSSCPPEPEWMVNFFLFIVRTLRHQNSPHPAVENHKGDYVSAISSKEREGRGG